MADKTSKEYRDELIKELTRNPLKLRRIANGGATEEENKRIYDLFIKGVRARQREQKENTN